MFNRQALNIQSTIEQFDELQIDQISFADLKGMLERRRDFTQMRDMNTSLVHSQAESEEGTGALDHLNRRIVLMLSDDFDRFKNVDQEVIYDSQDDSATASNTGRPTIKDVIAKVSDENFMRTCYKQRFLELICMIVKKDRNPTKKAKNPLEASANSYDIVSSSNGSSVEERKQSLSSSHKVQQTSSSMK